MVIKYLMVIGSGGQFNSIINVTDTLGITVNSIDFIETCLVRKPGVRYIEKKLYLSVSKT